MSENTMVKAEVDQRVNEAIESVQDKYELNKMEAALYVLRLGTHAYENKNHCVGETSDGFEVDL